MRRLLAWLAGAAGGLAAYRAVRHRPEPVPAAEPDARADELRAKLADTRAVQEDREEFEAGETPVDAAADPDTRRRSVHEQARAAIDEMRAE